MSLDCEPVRVEKGVVVGVIELNAVSPASRHLCGYFSQCTHGLYIYELEKNVSPSEESTLGRCLGLKLI
jgi:hypothetical protein